MTLAQILQRAAILSAELRAFHAENEALFAHERTAAAMRALYYAQSMRMDIGLIGKLTEAELFDRRPVIHHPPVQKTLVELAGGSNDSVVDQYCDAIDAWLANEIDEHTMKSLTKARKLTGWKRAA